MPRFQSTIQSMDYIEELERTPGTAAVSRVNRAGARMPPSGDPAGIRKLARE
ncbi:hypothetical protein ES705_29405 [subsurface metagenome]